MPRKIGLSSAESITQVVTEETPALDDRDMRILGALQKNARISYRDLGRIANLSANATAERVARLQKAGVILGYTATVSAASLGRRLSAYVDIKLRPGVSMDAFERALEKIDGIQHAASLTGTFDARLLVDVADPAGLGELIENLRKSTGVVETSSCVICRRLEVR